MRKFALLAVLVLAAVPAALAENSPTPSAGTLCQQQRTLMGPQAFKLLYGGASNAYGRCVSKLAGTLSQDTANASKQCAAERADTAFAASHDGKTFSQFYGTGKNGNNAFGKCVSSKAQDLVAEQQQATVNAAKTCKAERTKMGPRRSRRSTAAAPTPSANASRRQQRRTSKRLLTRERRFYTPPTAQEGRRRAPPPLHFGGHGAEKGRSGLPPEPDDEEAFERLYERHVEGVYRYASAMLGDAADAEDVTQTTFLNAYRAYKRGRGRTSRRAG